MRISAVVLTKNEEKTIKECLETLDFCDEVIVVDDHSVDRTREIAKAMGAKIFVRSLAGDFATQRNFGLKQAKGNWVLFVDADERVSEKLGEEITQKPAIAKICVGFYLKRRDYFLGRWLKYGETADVKILRLAKKNAGVWKRKVHELWEIERGRVGELKNPLWHFPHATISKFLDHINEYTTLDAFQFYQEGQRFHFWQIFLYPLAKFGRNYFLKLGFLDGFSGLVMALMMSLHSLITRVKLWELRKKKRVTEEKLLVVLILALAAFLRFWRLPQLMMFIGDFGHDYLAARDMVLTHRVPLVGIPSSIPWLHQGPLSLWMIAFSLWLWKFNPVVPAFLMAALGVLTVWLVFCLGKKMFGPNPALFGALLLAASPLSVAHSRMPYHTSPIPFFSILYLYSLSQFNLFWSPFLASILFQFELATAPLFALLPLAYFLKKRKIFPSKRELLIVLGGGLVPLIPRIAYDFSHGFSQTLGFFAWSGYRISQYRLSLGRILEVISIEWFYLKRFFFGF